MANIDSVFSDSTNFVKRIQNEISNAKSYIYICVSWVNVGMFMDALNQACHRGVEIKIITDATNRQANPVGLNEKIIVKKIGFFVDEDTMCLHNKFAIIDGETLILSSYNWSFNGKKNMEFITVITLDNGENSGSFCDSLGKFERQFLLLLDMDNAVLKKQYSCDSRTTMIIDIKNDGCSYLIDYDDLEQYYTSGNHSRLDSMIHVKDPTIYFNLLYDEEGRKKYAFKDKVYTDLFAIYEWHNYIIINKNGAGGEGFQKVYANLFDDFKAPQRLMLPPY